MMENSTRTKSTLSGPRHSKELVDRIKSLWQRTQAPDAVGFLREHDSIHGNRLLILELAYEEYCIRRDKGEAIQVSSFCRQFPSISRSLARQIEVEEYLRSNPALIGRQEPVKWPRRGDRLLGFLVVDEIGRGSFARVYLCAQPGIGNRQVVVKVAPGGASEANTMGRLNHPNIMPVYSVEEDSESNLTGICMPFVGRSTLFDVIDVAFGQESVPRSAGTIGEAARSLVRRNDRYYQLTPRVRIHERSDYVTGVMQIAVQLADALAHAHDQGVLHGDLKPSNIVMAVNTIPLIVDFNLSLGQGGASLVTGGTLPYMAPEQIRAVLLGTDETDRIDERSDIYSLGAILFESLTGQIPFPIEVGENSTAQAGRMLDAQTRGAAGWERLSGQVEAGIEQLVTQCLAYDASHRPASMMEVADDLRRFTSGRHSVVRYVRRRSGVTTALLGAVLATSAAAAVYFTQRPPLRDRAFQRAHDAYDRADYSNAINLLNVSIIADPDSAQAYIPRACAALQHFELDKHPGWLDLARSDLLQASRQHDRTIILALRGFCSMKRGNFRLAIAEYEGAIARQQATVDVWNNLGYCYDKVHVEFMRDSVILEHNIRRANESFRKAHTLGPDFPQPSLNLAMLELRRFHFTNGEYLPRDGLDAIRTAIRAGAKDAVAYYFASMLAAVVAEIDKSEALQDEALDYMEQAVAHGHSFEDSDPEVSYPLKVLQGHPRLQQILNSPPNRVQTPVMSRTIVPRVLSSPFDEVAQLGIK